ncbi:MAG: hypothetical protein ACKOCT_14745 [Alphaproteobacteria bacterium]
MTTPIPVTILLHRHDVRFKRNGYLLHRMLDSWAKSGVAVRIVRDTQLVTPESVLIPHIDLTTRPPEYAGVLDRFPVVVNRRVSTIAKSSFSTILLRRDDPYDGPVIVKTDLNYAGLPEKLLHASIRESLAFYAGEAMRTVGLRLRRHLHRDDLELPYKPKDYSVWPTLSAVPRGAFENTELVVEKFLPESWAEGYCLRYTYFLGDREMSFLLKSREKVIKGPNAVSCEEIETPPAIASLRERMGFDYGKFDYALRDGEVVLFDANWTPSTFTLEKFGLTERVAEFPADGIHALLGEAEDQRT